MNQRNNILTEHEEAFALSFLQEMVRLEMEGPAHILGTENSFSDIDFAKLMRAFSQVQKKLMDEQLERTVQVIPKTWPWPGLTSNEIIDLLETRKESQFNIEEQLMSVEDGQ